MSENNANSCAYIPTVEYTNNKGAVVKEESRLFLDLQHYFPRDRKKQVRYWETANDPAFLEYVEKNYPNLVKKSEQGELTLDSLLSLIDGKQNVVEADSFKTYIMDTKREGKEFDAIEFDHDENGFARGISQVSRFNRNSRYRKEYKARLIERNGKYAIELVKWKGLKKDDKTRFATKFVRFTRMKDVKYSILKRIARSGVDVGFVDDILEESIPYLHLSNEFESPVESGYTACLNIYRYRGENESAKTDAHFLIRAGLFSIACMGDKNDTIRRCLEILRNEKNESFVNEVLEKIKASDPEYYNRVIDESVSNGSTIFESSNMAVKQQLVLSYLVGQAMKSNEEAVLRNLPIVGSFARLFKNIVRNVRIFFSRIFNNSQKAEELIMSKLADEIASSFFEGEYGNASINLNNAVKDLILKDNTQFKERASLARTRIRDLMEDLKKTRVKIDSIGEIDDDLMLIEHLNSDIQEDKIYESAYRNDITNHIYLLMSAFYDEDSRLNINNLISNICMCNSFDEAMQVYGDELHAASLIIETIIDILNCMDFNKETSNTGDNEWKSNYNVIVSEINIIQNKLNDASVTLSSRYLASIIGADFVSVTLGKKFWGRKQTLSDLGLNIDENNKNGIIENGNKVIIPVSVLMTNHKDIGFIDRSIVSMGRCKDTVLQMIDVHNRKRQDKVRLETEKIERELSSLFIYARDNDVDIDDMYELVYDFDKEKYKDKKSIKNPLTGNFRAMESYDRYESDVRSFKEKCWEEFLDSESFVNVENNRDLSLGMRYKWNMFWEDKLEKWNTGNIDGYAHAYKIFIEMSDGRTVSEWRPCTSISHGNYQEGEYKTYDNYAFIELYGTTDKPVDKKQEAFRYVYDELIHIKRETDYKCLDFGSTKWYRAPQFKGSWINEMENRKDFRKNVGKTFGGLTRNFFDDSDSTAFGDDRYHEPDFGEWDPFITADQARRHVTDRIPLYGINKLKDKDTLSTDAISSMRAYTYMAENYKATRDCISTLEIYHDSVNKKNGKGRTVCPNKIAKLEQYYRNNFYGTGSKQITINEQKVVEGINRKLLSLDKKYGVNVFEGYKIAPSSFIVSSIVKTFNAATTLVFLGGNIPSAGINVMSGWLRLATEGLKGEDFTFWEFQAANMIWLYGKLKRFLWYGEKILNPAEWKYMKNLNILIEPDKVDLFIKMCDTKNNYQGNINRVGGKKVGDVVRDVNLFAYEWGDDYMSTIGFIASALHTKLIPEKESNTGKKKKRNAVSLWNALKVQKDENGQPYLDFDDDNRYFVNDIRKDRYRFAESFGETIINAILNYEGDTIEEKISNAISEDIIDTINKNIEITNMQIALGRRIKDYNTIEEINNAKSDEEINNITESLEKLSANEVKELKEERKSNVALIMYLAENNIVKLERPKNKEIEQQGYIDKSVEIDINRLLEGIDSYKNKQSFNSEDMEKMMYMGRMLNVNMHGVYNSTDRGIFQQTLIGSMISTMKGYFYGYFMREFLGSRIDIGNGKAYSIEEMEKMYNLDVLRDNNFGEDATMTVKFIFGAQPELKSILNEKDFHDIYNINILDTDIYEGSLMTCAKMLTSMKGISAFASAAAVSAISFLPYFGPKLRNMYVRQSDNDFITKEQRNNMLREWGMTWMIFLLGIMRTIVGGLLPPPEESEEDHKERLNNLIKELEEKHKNGTLTDREQKMYDAVNSISQFGMSEAEWNQSRRRALETFKENKRVKAKVSPLNLLYFCMAACEMENMAWNMFSPGAIVSEWNNTLSIMPPCVSMMTMIIDNMNLTIKTKHGEELMKKVAMNESVRELYDNDVNNLIKIYKEREGKNISHKKIINMKRAATVLTKYYYKNDDKRHMPLPDLYDSKIFNVEVDGVKLKDLSDEEIADIRKEMYNMMKEIWGKNESLFVQGNDGTMKLNTQKNKILHQADMMKYNITTLGAEFLTRNNDELNENIKKMSEEDEFGDKGAQYLVNRFYYGSTGYKHKKYDLKYWKKWGSYIPYYRTLGPATEPLKAIENRMYFMRGKR